MRLSIQLILLLALWSCSSTFAARNPNVVFILVDDLGWMDVGYQNAKVKTPHVDRLASEGKVFTAAYAAPVCSPTRASIMTGRTPATLKLTSHIPGVGFETYYKRKTGAKFRWMEAEILDHLPLDETTLAEALKSGGYTTGFFGKWHLAGEGSQRTKNGMVNRAWHPQAQGFDVNVGGCAYGQPAGPKPYFSPYANGEIADRSRGEYLTDRLADETVMLLNEHKDKPFFAFLSFYSIHGPHNPKPEVLQRTKGNRYLAMIQCMDKAVGRVLTTIDQLGMRNDTIVVFTSDNGGTRSQSPLRGTKGTLYEGGIRVPLIYRWPGVIAAGSKTDTPVSCEDFFPTLLDAAGVETPQEAKAIEGVSYLSLLTGKAEHQQRPLYQHFPHHRGRAKLFNGASSLRSGDWKLIWWHGTDSVELYQLADDIGESKNLAADQPARAAAMKQQLQQWLANTNANMPRPNPNYAHSAKQDVVP
ncbi:MAG: sulfatase [Pirellulales bacterium]|nr:sulfatase [Pirellulales bacterium]